MGIPFYFKSIVTTYPTIVKKPITKCNRLYLDYNCIVHQCAAQVMKEREFPNVECAHEAVIKSAIEYINEIVKTCKPHELLYVSVDGVCPRAKMSQQRKRRYMSVWQKEELAKERERLGIPNPVELWDSNIVTPGTDFMKKLDAELHKYAKKKTSSKLKVVISSSNEKGEGEHKIFNHLRSDADNIKAEDVIVIYGLDADLILLSLIAHATGCASNIHLLRERPEFNVRLSSSQSTASFCMLDISQLATGVCETFCGEDTQSEFPSNDKIREMVMLTTFVGNDFIPSLSFLKIKEGGIDLLMKAYKEARETCGKHMRLVAEDKTVNWLFLDAVLKSLAKNETINFAAANETYHNRRPYQSSSRDMSDPLWQKLNELDNYTIYNKSKDNINALKPGWTREYYGVLFGSNQPEIMEQACKKYTDGLEWNFEYYLCGERAPVSKWYYPFIYSPTIQDLSNFVSMRMCMSEYKSSAFQKFTYTPEQQLLMVLPPTSIKKFLPAYTPLLTEPAFGCMDMYPNTFKIMTYMKHQLWECSPLLPLIDDDRVKAALDQLNVRTISTGILRM